MSGILAVISYLGAGLLLATGLIRHRSSFSAAGIGLALAGTVLHGVFLWSTMVTGTGWDVNFFNNLSLVSWLVVVVLLLAAAKWPVVEVGVLAFPGAALWVTVQLFTNPDPVLLTQATPIVEIHIFSSLLAYAILSIAALNALAIFLQDRVLHRHSPAWLMNALPPLTIMERVLFQLILAGWLVLTVGLGTGLLFVDDLMAQHLVHKTTLSLTAWVLFGLLLGGRWRYGWRGRTAVSLTLTGMLILLLAYFGSKMVLEIILDRTWVESGA